MNNKTNTNNINNNNNNKSNACIYCNHHLPIYNIPLTNILYVSSHILITSLSPSRPHRKNANTHTYTPNHH